MIPWKLLSCMLLNELSETLLFLLNTIDSLLKRHVMDMQYTPSSSVFSVFIEFLIYQCHHIRHFHYGKAQVCSEKTLILRTANVWTWYIQTTLS